MRKLYYLLLLTLLSCGQQEVVNRIKVEYVDTPIHSSDFLSQYEAVLLDSSSPETFMAEINKLVIGKDRIFVYDRIAQNVLAFDRSGKFINSTENMIGRAGNEYIRLTDIAVDDNKKLLFMQCDSPYQMMILDYDLNFVSKVDMDYYCREIAVDDNYIYAVLPLVPDQPGEQYDYFVAMNRNNIAAKPKVILRMNNVHPTVGFQRALSSSNGEIYVCGRFDDAIYQVENGEIVKEYRIDFGERALPVSAKSKEMTSSQFFDKYFKTDAHLFGVSKVCSSDSLLLFCTNQAMMFVLNKNTMTCKGHAGFRSDKLPMTSSFSYPTSSIANNVIYEVDNSSFQNYMRRYKNGEAIRKLDDKLMAIAGKVDDNSNPVLIIWDIK